MSELKEEFINEVGNMIRIRSSKKKISGVDGVIYSIEGPHSVFENHITMMEAKMLQKHLARLLKEEV